MQPQIKLITPLAKQQEFIDRVLENRDRMCWFTGGTGSGKTWVMGLLMLILTSKYPRARFGFFSYDGGAVESCAASLSLFFDQVGRQFELKTSRRPYFIVNGIKMKIWTGGGSSPWEKISSENMDFIFCDEIAGLSKRTGEKCYNALFQRLRGKAGFSSPPLIVFSTARGKNWLYEKSKKKKCWVLEGTSSLDNPFTAEDYKEQLKENWSGAAAQQEVYGRIVDFEGLVWNPPYTNYQFDPHKPWYAGVDFGYNRSAWLAGQEFEENRHCIFYGMAPERMQTDDAAKLFKMRLMALGLKNKYTKEFIKPSVVFCDPAGDQKKSSADITDIQMLQRFLCPNVIFSHAPQVTSIAAGIRLVDRMIRDKRFYLAEILKEKTDPLDYVSIGEALAALQYEESPGTGRIMPNYLKDDLNDHAGDAVRYIYSNLYGFTGM